MELWSDLVKWQQISECEWRIASAGNFRLRVSWKEEAHDILNEQEKKEL